MYGSAYREAVQHGIGADYKVVRGKDQAFTCEVKGDTLCQRGTLSNGRLDLDHGAIGAAGSVRCGIPAAGRGRQDSGGGRENLPGERRLTPWDIPEPQEQSCSRF
uniref:Uncharacterized protein n=1 Tax=uncultured Armatimonadetes bacterium TaxID=157466 RepID=A0A6J4IQH2_9BACT|nr:hypothetical protein AVDCRST_MAG63-2176 [uncultured Armatimonadetes bacterium]